MAARLTAEFLKDWKTTVNPDLQKERDTATFRVEELTNILDGGPEKTKRRRDLENLFFTGENAELFSTKKRAFLTKSELYEAGVAKSVKLFSMKRDLNWSDEEFETAICVNNYDFTLSLHYTMFIPGLERLATDEQKSKWLPLAQSYKIIGTYAQTELGHGTNLLGLETTATFNPATDEFVLNTPHLSSMKWWPGALAKSSTHALVLAQLVIGDQRHGLHAFMVQLRSLDDHTPLPGIELGDIGQKLAGNFIDNGYMILNNVHIPRQNMLMRNAKVSRDGKFTQLSSNKANYATMILVRVKLLEWSFSALRHGACVAVRYSAVRRQTTLKPGTPEQQVLDFQTQQYKIFPCLAAAYAAFFTATAMAALYQRQYTEIMKGSTSKLAELHAMTSGLKAFVTDMAVMELEVARRACGGHGYLLSSGIADNVVSALPMTTVEGENTVLYLQTARYLMKQMANVLAGTKLEGHVAYLSRNLHMFTCPLQQPADCQNLTHLREIYRQRSHRLVLMVAQKLQVAMESGLQQEVVFNNNMVALVQAAKAHSHLTVLESVIEGLENMKSASSPQLFTALTDLCHFFAIHGIVAEAGDFLEMETVGLTQMDWLRSEELRLLAVIRSNAVALVDAFDLHDETVCSTLGRYDGNAYQHLYESTKYEALNKTEVHPSYYKYLRGLIKGSGPPAKL